ncbi:MAG TPA: MFS transporter, partial [Streptomyces sp.]
MALVPPGVHARQKMLAVLLGGQFLANVDTAIANVATPSIRAGLGASAGASTLVVSAYIVAFAVLMVPGARLGSTHGRRRTFLIGLALFTAASLACGLAPDVGTLIGARFGQGAG